MSISIQKEVSVFGHLFIITYTYFKKITSVMELDWGNVVSAGEDGVIIVWKSGILYD